MQFPAYESYISELSSALLLSGSLQQNIIDATINEWVEKETESICASKWNL